MNTTNSLDSVAQIAFFKVNKLHGGRSFEIKFDDNIKIIIADNGLGKTTILKLLVTLLSGRQSKLNLFEFESIEIGFRHTSNEVESELLTASDLALLSPDFDSSKYPRLERVREYLGSKEFNELIGSVSSASSLNELRRNPLFVKGDSSYIGTTAEFADDLLRAGAGADRLNPVDKSRRDHLRNFLERNFPWHVVYWPTFRRIEEDLERLGLLVERANPRLRRPQDSLINFGMQDVEERVRDFTEKIRVLTLRQYQTTNAKMLSTLALEPIPSPHIIHERLSRTKDLELMLSRLEAEIQTKAREKISTLVSTKAIFEKENSTLAFLLSNLIAIYDDTKHGDEQIKAFVNVSNKYLTDKYWYYNDIGMVLQIRAKDGDRPIALGSLSSGEKQLVSMLARLYLTDASEKKIAMFIDEPELSLSIEWQRTLLPDIVASGRCALLFAATHSPFIFENEFASNVEALTIAPQSTSTTTTS